LKEEDTVVSVVFKADLDEEEEESLQQQEGTKKILTGGSMKKCKCLPYFDKRNIRSFIFIRYWHPSQSFILFLKSRYWH
jgi:phage/plasmid primase-like uncharacterized protein